MKRTLKFERLYNLGNYSNVLIGDEITDLPDELFLREDIINKIRTLQMLNAEINYRRYLNILDRARTFSEESRQELIAMLESEKSTTLDDIKTLLGE